ncbi:glutamine amidotransferase [Echinicola pacifica]|uniref:Glutamine amidotransferase n=1 Tax=Echinicola pacifica TaxID=346377 RepID=A0A918UNJ5_9BACT|nr:aminodeoxychorismate/anthranilate synthase component II [Echinicola pacifica]GGZ22901.1 glutamine amidotransferase [Echinicola pacifica]
MLLLIDNFDSFSYILADYIKQLGFPLKIVRNDYPLEQLKTETFAGLILSPGPETPSKAGHLKEIFAYYHDKIPVLGVCLGHQCIGEHFGARLQRGKLPVHGKVFSVNRIYSHPVLEGLPEKFSVTRYHSLVLRDLPEVLIPILATNDGELMGMVHRQLPIVGIQYHPEAYLTEYGLELIANWARMIPSQHS